MTGAVIATVSVAASAIIDNFYWFFIFFSVFGGIGSGLILVQVCFNCSLVLISTFIYFRAMLPFKSIL